MEAASQPDDERRDEAPLRAFADGERSAPGEHYDCHASAQVALRFLRRREDAEDLLHDVRFCASP